MDKQRPTLYSERLVLRPFTLADANDVQRLAGAREIAETTANIPHPYEDGMAEEWISTHQAKFERGEVLNLAITRRRCGALIGAIGLVISAQHARAELGYWIGVPYWRQGYCTEAARALVDYAFEHLGLHRIHATHLKRNPASGRVMQKIGMAYEGCLREHLQKWGVFEDMVQYGLLASEWRARPSTR